MAVKFDLYDIEFFKGKETDGKDEKLVNIKTYTSSNIQRKDSSTCADKKPSLKISKMYSTESKSSTKKSLAESESTLKYTNGSGTSQENGTLQPQD